MDIKPCPCGEVPQSLGIFDANQGGKWAYVNASCCGEWTLEFRTEYRDLDSPECMELAVAAWNGAPRATPSEERKP